jgi:uncharacterized FlaG/YvyC family protein
MAETIGHFAPAPMPVRPDVRQSPAPVPETNLREVKTVAAEPALGQAAGDALTGQYTKLDNTKLTVSLDADTGTYVYKSVNADDGEVVWQWPSEQVMRVIQYFRRIETLEERMAAKRQVDQKA